MPRDSEPCFGSNKAQFIAAKPAQAREIFTIWSEDSSWHDRPILAALGHK
jgi:hypothetical protein